MSTSKAQIYSKGKVKGYLGYGTNWWFNPNIKNSFTLFDLDSFYPEKYFKDDHVNNSIVKKYADYVLNYGKDILGRNIKTILELGCGAGWFTEEFIKRKIDITAIEGSKSGYDKTKKRIKMEYRDKILKHDLRLPLNLNKQFDIALCTEVAEHIEPPFSSQLVQNLTRHSKLVWFSFEKPLTNIQHYHHSNEQPEKYWKNLFQFYDFRMLKLPKKVFDDLSSRGGYIFYHQDMKIPINMKKLIFSDLNNDSSSEMMKYSIRENLLLKISRILLKLANKLESLAFKILN